MCVTEAGNNVRGKNVPSFYFTLRQMYRKQLHYTFLSHAESKGEQPLQTRTIWLT